MNKFFTLIINILNLTIINSSKPLAFSIVRKHILIFTFTYLEYEILKRDTPSMQTVALVSFIYVIYSTLDLTKVIILNVSIRNTAISWWENDLYRSTKIINN